MHADFAPQQQALRLLLAQGLVTATLAALATWLFGKEASVSVLLGGLIGVFGSAWLALVMFRPSASSLVGRSSQQMVVALYVGELGRFLFVMAFFSLAFKKLAIVREPQNALFMLSTFAITQLVIWLWPLLVKAKRLPNDVSI